MGDGSTRRLPPWMIGVNSPADEGRKTSDGDENKDPKKKKKQRQLSIASNSEAKTTTTRKSFSLTRSESVGRENGSDRDCGDNTNLSAKRSSGNRKKVGRKCEAKSDAFGDGQEMSDPIDDYEELTVEDLVSIAEEYVKAEEVSRQKQSLYREGELQRQISTTAASSRNDLKVSLITSLSEQRLCTGESLVSCSSATSLSSKQSIVGAIKTGDPAQDMLYLFLGPLLKKPLDEEKRVEFLTEDVDFSYELKKQNQNNSGEEMVIPNKKKSSLKDKVSLLLD